MHEASVARKTIFSGTEATKFVEDLDAPVEAQSVLSYASSAFAVDDDGVLLPKPPKTDLRATEFLCPYCGITCPIRQAKGKAWKAHVIQDIQPYVCTYKDCKTGDQIYGSSKAWLEHERLTHRRVWQCFEHREPQYTSALGLTKHLQKNHEQLSAEQAQTLVNMSESTLRDERTTCPFCLQDIGASANASKHIARHMLAIATFSVP
ncbi:hypothetical protein BDZ85DRAFT_204362, partial [Elsinoe ampelina]